MSFELTALTIFFGSFLGIAAFAFRKIPVLVELPEVREEKIKWKELPLKLKEKVNGLSPVKSFSFEIFLQKLLSRIRILTLKTDNKTSNWLQGSRERSKKKKFLENDNYWEEIKKSTKK